MTGDPLWYKDAVVYELHVRSFFDSDGDGIGDFAGLIEKLDHIQDLGATAIWILPFYPSPMRDGGYDIADHTGVDPRYGTLADVRRFIAAAHARGLRVITELVANHTSDQHPWFQRARRAKPGSAHRGFYVWSDTPDRYREARVIFHDFEPSNWSWDPVAGAYYWHRFYSHQPDLNFDSPAVRKALTRVLDFWLKAGVDGLRLDAVPYLFEREGTSCENLPETHAFLKELRAHVERAFPGRMLLAEANQWPEDAVAYFGDGDECQMCFHFPLMPRLFMSLRIEDRFPIVDILEQTPAVPDTAQWGIFLRNHDELTLEMVTDEERDRMYRAYALDPEARLNLGIRRRLAPLLGNDRRRIELMNGLLLSLPGTPFVYYGDEIGMGDNIYLGDRDGVRSPMQWSGDRNAGFSRANRQRLFLPVIVDPGYHYEAVNVETQRSNPQSLLSWMKRVIALRTRHPAFGRGAFELLHPDERKVLAFVRRTDAERILVVANLSRFSQATTLDLSAFRGSVPTELFGGTPFPAIDDRPYLLTLGPHSFYWFALEEPAPAELATPPQEQRPVAIAQRWGDPLAPTARRALAERVPEFVRDRRWFAGPSRRLRSASIRDAVPLGPAAGRIHLALVDLGYVEGEPDTYLVPLSRVSGPKAEGLRRRAPWAVVAPLLAEDALVVDAAADPDLGPILLELVSKRRRVRTAGGVLAAEPTSAFPALRTGIDARATLAEVEQSNSSLVFGERLILKLFRRLEPGTNPELEIGRALTEARFPNVPATAGSIEYRPARGEPFTVAVLQAYVPNEGDAWSEALAAFGELTGRAASSPAPEAPVEDARALVELARAPVAEAVAGAIGPYLERAALLGRRTAELHAALASIAEPGSAPEPFGHHSQRALSQSLHALATTTLDALRAASARVPPEARDDARAVLASERRIDERFRALRTSAIDAVRIRTHGDLHLGQVLVTAGDVVFIDFEGEPARSIGERRLRHSALRDVAGMLRSFARAAEVGRAAADGGEGLAQWSKTWRAHVSARYLRAYLETAGAAAWLPRGDDDIVRLLDALLLERALSDVLRDLSARPHTLRGSLAGVRRLLV